MKKRHRSKMYTYKLLQIAPVSTDAKEAIFRSKAELEQLGRPIAPAHYKQVYHGQVCGAIPALLNNLYMKFNLYLPSDFRGRTMSLSDIILLYHNNREEAYYCDSIGFQKIADFNSKEVMK